MRKMKVWDDLIFVAVIALLLGVSFLLGQGIERRGWCEVLSGPPYDYSCHQKGVEMFKGVIP